MSLGVEALPTRRCAEIGGSHWPMLLARLQHAQRIAVNGDEIEIIWVKEALFAARRRAKAARDRGRLVAKTQTKPMELWDIQFAVCMRKVGVQSATAFRFRFKDGGAYRRSSTLRFVASRGAVRSAVPTFIPPRRPQAGDKSDVHRPESATAQPQHLSLHKHGCW